MNRDDLYSNKDFTEMKKKINEEILRRGTYKWWNPLTTPSVGIDKDNPLNTPEVGNRMYVDDKTYTINNSSEGSIEPTRNIHYPEQGENPAGEEPGDGYKQNNIPNTSAAQFNLDEMKNLLVGLSKIMDINLFYGRDEVDHLAFRDPQGIRDVIERAKSDILNKPLHLSDNSPTKNDPNGGIKDRLNPLYPVGNCKITYPMENGIYVMPSGEYDGEETKKFEGVGVRNFYDDYGAKPGDSNYHPYNRYVSEEVRRDWNDQDNDRNTINTVVREGGVSSLRFGPNPRNPQMGNPYRSRPVYGGVDGACNVACTGMCHVTCDNECSESCMTTCWNRCGNACSASCGNVCTGCSTLCYTTCKTKCENSTGYSCYKSGAKDVKITTTGGVNGEPAKNNLTYTTYTCQGCSYSCQFYPNKKTECWDTGCMGRCFTSCSTSCSTSCFGGCIDNDAQSGTNYRTGKGRGCSGGCTVNCIGICKGVCEGYCIQTCWHACKQTCSDNCSFRCDTNCGSGCSNACKNGCGGCSSCSGTCEGEAYQRGCIGCGIEGGCTSTCQHDCNKNCIGWGCRSICGMEAQGACEANCRLNCTGTSCTSMCSDACSDQCTTCVNSCGFQCGACVSECSVGCGAACNITCTEECSNSCSDNCVHSCSETCGGCSNLCYSCVGMCIGVCSVKCEDGCSSCANQCGWWCDSSCNQECFSNCSNRCINTCSGSCSTYLMSETTMTTGPERKPTSEGFIYPNPKNRYEERESFKLFRDLAPYKKPVKEPKPIIIGFNKDKKSDKYKYLEVSGYIGEYWIYSTSVISGVFNVDHTTGKITINKDMLPPNVPNNELNLDSGNGIFVIMLPYNKDMEIKDEDIGIELPFGFEYISPIRDEENNIFIIIYKNRFLFPEEDKFEWEEYLKYFTQK